MYGSPHLYAQDFDEADFNINQTMTSLGLLDTNTQQSPQFLDTFTDFSLYNTDDESASLCICVILIY